MFFDRSSKDERKNLIALTAERMKLCAQGKYPSLIIFPEGGTTNGTELIKFANGAFLSLESVQPFGVTYHSVLMDITNGCIPFESHYLSNICNPFAYAKAREFPVFKPNEYFWKHHQREGEEKTETYSRVIREIMSEHLNMPMSDLSFRDKVQYRAAIFGGSSNLTD